jgi:hypothetical protein
MNAPYTLSSILMELLAIRLSPQAGKSLVISRKRARRQTRMSNLVLVSISINRGN